MGSLRVVAAGLALALVPAVAAAQPNKPTPQQMQQAGDLVKKAIAKSQAGDHAQAIDLYNQAYLIAPAPILLSNIGSEYQQLQKPVEALKYFCKYIEADAAGSNASYASAQAKSLQIQLGNEVDDKDVCHPLPKKAPPPPPPPDGGGGTGGSGVTGTAGLGGSTSSVGGVAAGGGGGGDDHAKPGATLEYVGIGVGVVGLVGVALGVNYGLKAKSLNDAISGHKTTDPWPDNIDGVPIGQWDQQGHDWNVDTAVFSIAGGIAVLAGGAMILVGHSKNTHAQTEHAMLVPTAGPQSAGLAVLGSF